MKTLLQNVSSSPVTLPLPMRGILPAGAKAVLSATPDQVRAALGTLAVAGIFQLSVAEPSASDDGGFYLGNLLDPLATVAAMNTAIAAAVSGQASTSQPARVSSGLLDASAPATLTLLAAPHTAGLYRVNRRAFVKTAGTGGTFAVTHGWKDTDGGVQTSATGALDLTVAGQANLGNATDVVHSDGTAAITLAIAFTSPTGTPSVRLEGSVTPVG